MPFNAKSLLGLNPIMQHQKIGKNIIEQDMKVNKVQDSFTFFGYKLKTQERNMAIFQIQNYKNLTTKY